jgi:hypothetical protein
MRTLSEILRSLNKHCMTQDEVIHCAVLIAEAYALGQSENNHKPAKPVLQLPERSS